MTRSLVAWIVLAVVAGVTRAEPPAAGAALAYADAQTLPAGVRQYTRYLELGDIPEKDRETLCRVLDGHLNAISTEPTIYTAIRVGGPKPIPGLRAGAPLLLRINTEHYGPKWRQVFEKLKDVDPYFHVRLETEEFILKEVTERIYHPGGRFKFPNGNVEDKETPEGTYTVTYKKQVATGEKTVKGAAAPWLPTKEIAGLIEMTQSQVPIVRASWFLQYTAIQADRNPGYYDFLGVKDQKTFEQLVGFDEKASRKFSDLYREAVARSRVLTGAGPRRIERFDKIGGALWRTLDSRVRRDKNNPLRILNGDLEFDVTEQLAHLPNGFLASLLADNKGVRQDSAPDFIASHQDGAASDSRVHINITCYSCHKNGGLHDFQPWARRLFKPPRGLQAPDYEKLKELERQYLRPLEEPLEDDRRIVDRAVYRATGWKAAEWAPKYYAAFARYTEARVDLAWAANSVGCTPKQLQDALAAQVKATGTVDLVLSTLLDPEADPLSIESWEEVYALAQSAVAKVVLK